MCVHTRHCCIEHGCKYGDEDCPVANGIAKQECICEQCSDFGIDDLEELEIHVKLKKFGEKIRQQAHTYNLKEMVEDFGFAIKQKVVHNWFCDKYHFEDLRLAAKTEIELIAMVAQKLREIEIHK